MYIRGWSENGPTVPKIYFEKFLRVSRNFLKFSFVILMDYRWFFRCYKFCSRFPKSGTDLVHPNMLHMKSYHMDMESIHHDMESILWTVSDKSNQIDKPLLW